MKQEVAVVTEAFAKVFGDANGLTIVRAPGRVNLIGEHTDYNDGYVFPMAINFDIVMAARKRPDQLVRIHACDLERTVAFSLADPIAYDPEEHWSNYLRGVLWALQEAGVKLCGMEIAFLGTIPQGSGLSSSAALEVATAVAVKHLTGFDFALPELALLCQRAENDFVGMKCGIMDQFISLLGQKDHALLIDCRTLDYERIPLELGDYRILVCHSGVKHRLVDSEYNRRRQECEIGVRVLAAEFPSVKALRDADLNMLAACQTRMAPVIYKRCRHVITENERVLRSVPALKAGDLRLFGELLNQSHDSLREDYEVSCAEIDLLVTLARKVEGVLGARITGGGFGGCTVNLIHAGAVDEFTRRVLPEYRKRTGMEAQVYVSTAANGAEIL
ncbi:MAG TPA: galactokinase [Firmicutes bacterium]|uniref:Galactokinase n=1 Tax=Capillibacterium thermochitinicola TaxID=2699427 RepID=A0A8J6I3F5_9FIRM|nr:galactokinase [Capillibacterium thermochitinicola]MBA2133537.1 galactokinase [Capillibacterium thermochitinicola]HHW13084.1 galactokinase [Bacillota bacterium]